VGRLAVGTNGYSLQADSTAGTGLSWGAKPQLTETVFTSTNATYAIPAGVTGIWALCVGSGGGGGASSTATATNTGGGGGAGQAIEKYFAISGDTTLNITVATGGAGGSAGAAGASGSASSIVGNTSATTYISGAGGGGGGGGAAANVTGLVGASGGGNGSSSLAGGGAGGGMSEAASNASFGVLGGTGVGGTAPSTGGGAAPTTASITGQPGGNAAASPRNYGGLGIRIFGRNVCGGGHGGSAVITAIAAGAAENFGTGVTVAQDVNGSSATANTGAGGGSARTGASTAYTGGNGGSGLVVIRYVF
jgi:hypothetical protein